MRSLRVAVASLAVAAAGCGAAPPAGSPDASPRPLSAERLGRCESRWEGDSAEPVSFVSSPGAWLQVMDIEVPDPAQRKTVEYRGTYAVVGGDRSMTRPLGERVETLKMHGSIAAAAADALRDGAVVHVHTGVVDDPRHVAYALATWGSGFAFLGDCQYRLLTEPIARRLGPDQAKDAAALVGLTAPELRRALGSP
jgi:hypothetical protein